MYIYIYMYLKIYTDTGTWLYMYNLVTASDSFVEKKWARLCVHLYDNPFRLRRAFPHSWALFPPMTSQKVTTYINVMSKI